MVKLMDSSVRDGGNVNDWNFGRDAIVGIVNNLESAGIDYIELGYLKDGNHTKDSSLFNFVSEAEEYVPFNSRARYSLMVQEDKWTWDKLTPCNGGINIIRVSFHKTDIKEGLELCRHVMKLGYECHCNPINIMGYTDVELLRLIEQVNALEPYCFTIVDTFGAMMLEDMRRICALIHHNLKSRIIVAAHLHENIGLSFALAIEFMNYFEGKRNVVVDATLMGIGRVPGNLCIENVAIHCNREYGKNYQISYIYDAIDDYIESIKKEHPWGYELGYAMQAFYNVHRTYPEYLLGKGKLKSKEIGEILSSIPPEESVIYNEKFIEGLYRKYMFRKVDDKASRDELNNKIGSKCVVILASGFSLIEKKEAITSICENEQAFVFSINFIPDFISPDCIFINSSKRLSQLRCKVGTEETLIALTSNIMDDMSNTLIFDYESLTKFEDKFCEDGVLMLLSLLTSIGLDRLYYIAGFDGLAKSSRHAYKGMNLGLAQKNYDDVIQIMNGFEKKYNITIL